MSKVSKSIMASKLVKIELPSRVWAIFGGRIFPLTNVKMIQSRQSCSYPTVTGELSFSERRTVEGKEHKITNEFTVSLYDCFEELATAVEELTQRTLREKAKEFSDRLMPWGATKARNIATLKDHPNEVVTTLAKEAEILEEIEGNFPKTAKDVKRCHCEMILNDNDLLQTWKKLVVANRFPESKSPLTEEDEDE